ncbi:MAG TPA: DUF898 family protein [Beijerinckiaceae bacterium]|jgi:uncharacterized membrane protein YjgN (DUF898 family)
MNIAVPAPPITPQVPLPDRTPVAFAGNPGDFMRLLVRGGLLQIPTAGFYRFWLITDVRRHLWGNTRIGRETLEYTGTGRELLIGFMIALAVLAPIYVAYFVAGLMAERLQAFASLPLFLLLYVFGQYAAFRARRYRATRTIFRGVRFWMTGSAWRYAGKAILWDLATVLSLGLALPWRMAALERYKMQNTRFGDLPGEFAGTGGDLFRRGFGLWLLTVGLIVATAAFALGGRSGLGAVLGMLTLISLVIVLPLSVPFFRAFVIQWLIAGLRFGGVSFESTLTKGAVVNCYAKWLAANLGLGIAFAVASWVVFAATGGSLKGLEAGLAGLNAASVGGIAVTVVLYLAFLIGVSILKRYFLDRGVWVAVAASTTVVNLKAADHVTAAGEPAGSLGEGLADALDVGAI